jgi:hypothetical protein
MIYVSMKNEFEKQTRALQTVEGMGLLNGRGEFQFEAMWFLYMLVLNYGGPVENKRWFLTRVRNQGKNLRNEAQSLLMDLVEKYISFEKMEEK